MILKIFKLILKYQWAAAQKTLLLYRSLILTIIMKVRTNQEKKGRRRERKKKERSEKVN